MPTDGNGGFAVGLVGKEDGGEGVTDVLDDNGEAASFEEVEVEVMVEAVMLF